MPILPDDTAREVFDKVTDAAEGVLRGTLPALVAGSAPRIPQDARAATYFGSRTPEDGRIDWSKSAKSIHDLVRAVAPPYPGASTTVGGRKARVLRTRLLNAGAAPVATPSMTAEEDVIVARCGGGSLAILELEIDGAPISGREFAARYGALAVPLG